MTLGPAGVAARATVTPSVDLSILSKRLWGWTPGGAYFFGTGFTAASCGSRW